MQPFVKHTGLAVPLDRSDVDTDQIIKRIERTGFGQFLFFDWRYLEDGSPNPEFILNHPRYRCATILLARRNFGCGSSREHAPWALADYGFRAIIAPSFADIFYNNSLKNGLLPVRLPEDAVDELFRYAQGMEGYRLTVDLEQCLVADEQGFRVPFELDPFRRECLLRGLDDIGLTLEHEDKITADEKARGLA